MMHYWIEHLRLVPPVLCLVLAVPSVEAHDVWITTIREGSAIQVIIHHGHPGDRKTPDPDKLFECNLTENDQRQQSLLSGIKSVIQHEIPVLMTEPLIIDDKADTWLLNARYDNGYWVKTAHGHRNTSKLQVPDAEESLSSMKYAKALVQMGPGSSTLYGTVVGHRLELVPLSNPFAVKPGETLRVRVYFDGKPLRGAEVESGDGLTPMREEDIPRFKTDEQGIAVVRLHQGGSHLLVVDYRVPSIYPELASHDRHNATLSFVTPD